MNPQDPDDFDDFDDFEYELEAAAPSKLCVHCGNRLMPSGECAKCGNLAARLEKKFGDEVEQTRAIYGNDRNEAVDAELDEYGLPIDRPPEPERVDYLEMEKLGDDELPASFYAIAMGVLLLISVVAVGSNDPALACKGAGMLAVLCGIVGMFIGYSSMRPQLGGFGKTKGIPLQALLATFFPGSTESPPDNQGVAVAKWSLLALLFGILCLILSWLLSLAGFTNG